MPLALHRGLQSIDGREYHPPERGAGARLVRARARVGARARARVGVGVRVGVRVKG